VFGNTAPAVPYVFAPRAEDMPPLGAPPRPEAPPPPEPAPPEPSGSPAPPAASADAAEPTPSDGEPAGDDEVNDRNAPKRAPRPRPVKGVTATLTWRAYDIERFPIPLPQPGQGSQDGIAGGGIYIVRSGAGPLYVGEAASFAARWNKRLREAFQVGLIKKTLADRRIRMWLGTINPAISAEARKTLESAIIRVLLQGGFGHVLRNDRSFHEIRALAPLDITNVVPPDLRPLLRPNAGLRPSVVQAINQVKQRNTLVVAAQDVFEVEFYDEPVTVSPGADPRMAR
jgi:hypothetical protein